MKSILIEIGLIAGVSSLISLLLSYGLISIVEGNGVNENEFLFLLVAPAMIFFIIMISINSILIKRYRRLSTSNLQTHWIIIFITLTVMVVVFSIVFDYLYHAIDSDLGNQFEKAMREMLMTTGSSDKEVQEFINLPLFLQSILVNFIGISFGCLFATFFTRYKHIERP
jgi:hypothetical protein